MAHFRKFAVMILAALLAQQAAEAIHGFVGKLSQTGIAVFSAGLPWQLVWAAALVGFCIWLKKGFYHRQSGIGRLTVLGLISVHYAGLALSHWHNSLVEIGFFCLSLVVLCWLAFRFRDEGVHVFDTEGRRANRYLLSRGPEPEARPGLILFLSFLTSSDFRQGMSTKLEEHGKLVDSKEWRAYQESALGLIRQISAAAGYSLDNPKLLAPLGRLNLRMPLEAIRVQLALRQLRHVVLIPSRDAPLWIEDGATGKGLPYVQPFSGSQSQTDFFTTACKELFRPIVRRLPEVHIASPADFEREEELTLSISEARQMLKEKGVDRYYLDLTGGQALCSVVGAVRSLGEDARCLYISTRDYKAVSYNFVADPPPEV